MGTGCSFGHGRSETVGWGSAWLCPAQKRNGRCPVLGAPGEPTGDSFPASHATCPCPCTMGPRNAVNTWGGYGANGPFALRHTSHRNQWPVTWPSALSLEALGVWEGARGSRCSLGPCFSFLPVPEKSPEGSALTRPCTGWGGGRSCSARALYLVPSGEQCLGRRAAAQQSGKGGGVSCTGSFLMATGHQAACWAPVRAWRRL